MEGYSPGPTLGPKYWEFTSSDPIVTPARTTTDGFLRGRELLDYGIGIQTSGTDLVGRHSWSAVAQALLSGGELQGGLSYSFRGLGNPILSLAVNQGYSDGGQQLTASLDTLFTLERERTVNGAMSFRVPARHGLPASQAGSSGRERERVHQRQHIA